MRNTLRTLVMVGSLAATASIANAQTVTLLDSLKGGINLNQTVTDSTIAIGYDSGQGVNTPPIQGDVPATKPQSGYAVVPFSLGGSGTYNVSQVSFEGAILPPVDTTITNFGHLYGAFIMAPVGSSLNANQANVVGGFFQFTVGPTDSSNHIEVANLPTGSQPTLTAGMNYWLVLSPKAGFAVTTSDTPLAYGQANTYDVSELAPGASLSGIATERQNLWEAGPQGGANPGDVLMPAVSFNVGTGTNPGYVPVRIVATAGVPETSTVVTALLGLAPIGGLLARRRRAS